MVEFFETEQMSLTFSQAEEGPQVWTVSQLTAYLTGLVDEDTVLGNPIIVRGELSNVSKASSGHIYASLKDEASTLRLTLWSSLAKRLPFTLENGLEVFATGTFEIYARGGSYSLIAKAVEPVGKGALQLAFEQLFQRLEAEGLFRPEFKKTIPAYPERVGLITSKTGAVLHDMLRVIRRKDPALDIVLVPVPVQGEGAAHKIAAAIAQLNAQRPDLDVVIVARGGGSLEDLFCFSGEPVVRAIFASELPIVTGIGHEPDISLADLVADLRASTPTAAAEVVTGDMLAAAEWLADQRQVLSHNLDRKLCDARQWFDERSTQVIERQRHRLARYQDQLTHQQHALATGGHWGVERARGRLAEMAQGLDGLSPLATLGRGYAWVTDSSGQTISQATQVTPGDAVAVRLAQGRLTCQVTKSETE